MPTSRAATTFALAATLALAPLDAGSAAEAVGQVTSPKTIVGSWLVQITPTIQPPFTSLSTFTQDGGFIATDSSSLVAPLYSPGLGQWSFAPHRNNTYDLTFLNLLTDEHGAFAGIAKVRARGSLTNGRREFEGTFAVDVFDPAGALVFSDDGTLHGTRIKLEPLP